MDSLSSVSPSIVLPPTNPLPNRRRHRPQVVAFSFSTNTRLPSLSSFFSVMPKGRLNRVVDCKCKFNGGDARRGEENGHGDNDDDVDGEKEEVERALHLDGTIPSTSGEFLRRVSSRAYDMRRHLQQSFDSSSYDGKRSSANFGCFSMHLSTLFSFNCDCSFKMTTLAFSQTLLLLSGLSVIVAFFFRHICSCWLLWFIVYTSSIELTNHATSIWTGV